MHTQTPTDHFRDTSHSEQVVLGVLLNCPEQFDRVRERIPADAFTEPFHQDLFQSLCVIREAGNGVFTLAAIERELHRLDQHPDDLMALLRRLMDCGCSPAGLDYDLGVVEAAFERRTAVLALKQSLHELENDRVPACEAIHRPALHYEKLGARTLRRVAGSNGGLRFLTLGELEPASEPDWVWPGYAATGCITMLSAAPKAGKSTLLRSLLSDLYSGGPLAGGRTLTEPTLIVSEETIAQWSRQSETLGLPKDLVHLCAQPFYTKPTCAEWERLVFGVAEKARELKPRLVIFDTLSNLWSVRDENSAAEVNTALMPIRAISQTGASVILVHHDRKSGGSHGEGARGSSALCGFPEALVQLRRYRDEPGETRRKLLYVGRFDGTEPQVILDCIADRYRVLGAAESVEDNDLVQQVLDLLPPDGEGVSYEQIRSRVQGLGNTKLRALLRSGATAGTWLITGSGRRNDPQRFHRVTQSFQSLREGRVRNETPDREAAVQLPLQE
jgi:hypothetical protein